MCGAQGCLDTVSQTGWLKQQKLTVSQLEIRSQGVHRVDSFLEALRENLLLASSLQAPLGAPWLVAVSLQSLPLSLCGVLPVCLLS